MEYYKGSYLYGCFDRNIRYVLILVLCRDIFGTYFQVILTSWIGIVKVSDLVAKVPTWRSSTFWGATETFYCVSTVYTTKFSSGVVRLEYVY